MSDLISITRTFQKNDTNEKRDEKRNDYKNYKKKLKTDLEERAENKNLKYSDPYKISIIDEKMDTEAITTVEYKHATFVIIPPKGFTGMYEYIYTYIHVYIEVHLCIYAYMLYVFT
jgi:hypothetical protein